MSSRVIVTGGASGIGAACVERLREDGARVVVLDREGESPCDVTDAGQVARFVESAARELDGLDGLVACAGIVRPGTVVESSPADVAAVFSVNVHGIFNVCREVIPHMRSGGTGSVVLLGSQLAIAGEPGVAAYIASKGAVIALGRAMAIDHAAEGIRVNVVCPGPTMTPMNRDYFESCDDPAAAKREVEQTMLHRRMVLPEEIADAVAYLLSRRAGSTIGATLVVDGGFTVH